MYASKLPMLAHMILRARVLAKTCTISEPEFPEVWRLHGPNAPAGASIAQLPNTSKALALSGSRALWRAPNTWLVIGAQAQSDCAEWTETSLYGLINLTGAVARIRCTGPAWRLLLQSGCPLDLEGDAAPGCCAASIFGPFDILIDVVEENEAHVFVARSYADDFAAALERARRCL
jgi:heterotetrameric sarcosine oxidase gamma subunit